MKEPDFVVFLLERLEDVPAHDEGVDVRGEVEVVGPNVRQPEGKHPLKLGLQTARNLAARAEKTREKIFAIAKFYFRPVSQPL